MKTNAFRYLGLALMAVLTLSLTSCEVEIDSFYDDDNIGGGYYNRSSDLCSRTWVSFYRDVDGNRCRQELDFYLDRTGVDFIRVDYGRNDVSYLDDVYIGGNRLSGYLDGRNNFVEYTGR